MVCDVKMPKTGGNQILYIDALFTVPQKCGKFKNTVGHRPVVIFYKFKKSDFEIFYFQNHNLNAEMNVISEKNYQ